MKSNPDIAVVGRDDLLSEEYLYLLEEAQWGSPTQDDVHASLSGTLVTFTIRNDGKICGVIRVLGDGRLCFYIQDLIVAGCYRGRGFARKLLDAAMEYIHDNAAHNAFVGLMAAKGLERFYESYGFRIRPNEAAGAGMTLFWGRPGEVTEC